MLALNHATSATAVALSLSLALDRPFSLPLLAFVVFGSLLPDIDHTDSQISKSMPLVARLLKHRGPTHSLLGLAVFAGVCFLLLGIHPILSYLLIFFGSVGLWFLLEILENQVRQIRSSTGAFFSQQQLRLALGMIRLGGLLFFIMLVIFVWKRSFSLEIFWLLLIGYAVHLLGDFATKEGVPWLWPKRRKFALKLFKTGGFAETLLGLLLLLLNGFLIYTFIHRFEVLEAVYWQNYLPFLEDI